MRKPDELRQRLPDQTASRNRETAVPEPKFIANRTFGFGLLFSLQSQSAPIRSEPMTKAKDTFIANRRRDPFSSGNAQAVCERRPEGRAAVATAPLFPSQPPPKHHSGNGRRSERSGAERSGPNQVCNETITRAERSSGSERKTNLQ